MSYTPLSPIQNNPPESLFQQGSMPRLTAAKQRVPSATVSPPRIMIQGNGLVAGEGSGSGTYGMIGARANSWPVVMAKKLGWQTGSFFGSSAPPVQWTAFATTLPAYDPRITLPGNWIVDTNFTYGTTFIITNPGAGGAVSTADFTFTPESAFDTFSVYYPVTTSQSNNIIVKIDGVTVGTITDGNVATTAQNAHISKSFTCTLGTHTISIQSTDATSSRVAFIAGIETRVSTSTAPILLQGGRIGSQTGAKAPTVGMPLLSDICDVGASAPWYPGNATGYLKPDVVVTMCLLGDMNAGSAIAVTQPSIDSIVNAAQLAKADPVFVGDSPFSSGAAGALTVGAGQANVFNGSMSIAEELMQNNVTSYNGSFIDTRAIFGGSFQQSCNKGYMFDNQTPNAKGHAEIANLVSKIFA